MITILVVTLIVTILLNIPIGICLGVASIMALLVQDRIPLLLVAQRMLTGIDMSTLLAIPLFIFAGKVMEKGGISRRLVDLAYATVGFLPGSLGMVTVLSCMFFAALSGSAPATVAAIGGIMVPIMIKEGYPADFSASLVAAAGTIGVIIPPSIPFVNYAVIANVSIGDMFIAGVLPGIFMGIALILYCYYMAKKYKFGDKVIKFSIINFSKALVKSILALLMPLIVLGGIYAGVFTPTEAAAVACVYGVIVSVLVNRELSYKELPELAYESGVTSAMIMLIIATATSFSWILTTQQVPAKIASFVTSFAKTPLSVLLLINALLLINGCFMELTASMFIFTPILLPIISSVGVDLVHYGVIQVMNMTLGLLTPPLGVNLFVAKGLDERTDFNGIVKYVIPMFGVLLVVLLIVTYIPSISLVLLDMLR